MLRSKQNIVRRYSNIVIQIENEQKRNRRQRRKKNDLHDFAVCAQIAAKNMSHALLFAFVDAAIDCRFFFVRFVLFSFFPYKIKASY